MRRAVRWRVFTTPMLCAESAPLLPKAVPIRHFDVICRMMITAAAVYAFAVTMFRRRMIITPPLFTLFSLRLIRFRTRRLRYD